MITGWLQGGGGGDDLRTQRRESEKEKGGKITKGSRCMKCLPFSENAPVMISVVASSDGIVLRRKKKHLVCH